MDGGRPCREERREIGAKRIVPMFRELLMLVCLLKLDLSEEIVRKMAIVDRRAPK